MRVGIAVGIAIVAGCGSEQELGELDGHAGYCRMTEVADASGTADLGAGTLDYTGGIGTGSVSYKRDVDPVEGGCVGSASLTLTDAIGQCALSLAFETVEGRDELVLSSAQLVADSGCATWLDDEEGTFVWAAGQGEGTLRVDERLPATAEQSWCVDLVLAPEGVITLTAPDRSDLELDLGRFAVSGPIQASGRDWQICPGD